MFAGTSHVRVIKMPLYIRIASNRALVWSVVSGRASGQAEARLIRALLWRAGLGSETEPYRGEIQQAALRPISSANFRLPMPKAEEEGEVETRNRTSARARRHSSRPSPL